VYDYAALLPSMDEYHIDELRARRAFERAAPTYLAAARLEREIGERMLERLDLVRLEPGVVVDAGAGPAPQAEGLRRRYPDALHAALDWSRAMLRSRRGRSGWIHRILGRRGPAGVCADMRRMPFAAGSCGLVWSNMALHCVSDPLPVLAEFSRVLRPDGLLMFSTLGPDTLKELRSAYAAAGVPRNAHRFHDMHDLGDMLAASGFAAPVMDMEIITLTYASAAALTSDLRATGQTSSSAGRSRTLTGKRRWATVRDALEARALEGRIPFTVEVVYGHAWKGAPRRNPDAGAIVRIQKRR
jgi:malonyl-CoA O-methyltransferase